MPERIDRRIGSAGMATTALIVLLVAVGVTVAVWRWRTVRVEPPIPAHSIPIRNPRPDEPVMVMRYLPLNGGLTGRSVAVKREADTQAQARGALSALFAEAQGVPILSTVRVRSFFIDAAGVAYVDFTTGTQDGIKSSAGEELLALYAVVNTLTENFEEVRQVRFLVEGRETQTLAGHMDLTRAFTKRSDLVK